VAKFHPKKKHLSRMFKNSSKSNIEPHNEGEGKSVDVSPSNSSLSWAFFLITYITSFLCVDEIKKFHPKEPFMLAVKRTDIAIYLDTGYRIHSLDAPLPQLYPVASVPWLVTWSKKLSQFFLFTK
jgi:hypothetical protein